MLRLVNERNDWQSKFLAVSQNPADVPTLVPTGSQEFGAAEQQGGEYRSPWLGQAQREELPLHAEP